LPDIQSAIPLSAAAPVVPGAAVRAAPDAGTKGAGAKDAHSGFTFHDFLNIINPLQHIPVVSTIYREITGDEMKPISGVLGGALFGGVIGLATSAVDAIIQEATGKDFGAHVLATLGLHHDHTEEGANAQVANGQNPAGQGAAAQQANAVAQVKGGLAPAAARGAIVPVPAFLIAEAEADRLAQAAKSAKPASPTIPQPASQPTQQPLVSGAPVGTVAPTDFWRSLQRGGAGVTHAGPPSRPMTINPPKPATGGPAGGQPAPIQGPAPTPVPPAGPTLTAPSDAQPIVVTPSVVSALQGSPTMTAAAAAPAAPIAIAPSLADAAPAGQAPAASPAGASAAGAPQPLPRAAIPQMMMQALAKYEAMHKAPQAQAVDQIH